MPKLLKESLKTIESYKMTSPHYEELLDILGDILILREEYRQKMPAVIFPVDDSLIEKKMAGGLPLIDFSAGHFDLSKPKEYFLALLDIAEKKSTRETTDLVERLRMAPLLSKDWFLIPSTPIMMRKPMKWKKISLILLNCFLKKV